MRNGPKLHERYLQLSVLLEYTQAALRHANYEILQDDESYYGEIWECPGVYANAESLKACREQLRRLSKSGSFSGCAGT